MLEQTQRRRSLRIGKTLDQHFVAGCRGISSCYQYLNDAKLRLSDLHNDDSRCRTVGCSLTSHPGHIVWTSLRSNGQAASLHCVLLIPIIDYHKFQQNCRTNNALSKRNDFCLFFVDKLKIISISK